MNLKHHHVQFLNAGRKEGNVLFNDELSTFYLRLYGVRHMVKDHSDSKRGNPQLPHRLLLSIHSKGSFICTIPQTGYHIPRPLLHQSWSTGWNEKYLKMRALSFCSSTPSQANHAHTSSHRVRIRADPATPLGRTTSPSCAPSATCRCRTSTPCRSTRSSASTSTSLTPGRETHAMQVNDFNKKSKFSQ